MIFASALLICWYVISYYGAFDVCLSDDVEFRYGKKRARNRRKTIGWWRKFLFLDIKNDVIQWHYVMFWVNLVSSVVAIVALSVNIICDDKASRMVFVIVEGTALFSYTLILYVRWKLYAGNKVRSRKKRRFHWK